VGGTEVILVDTHVVIWLAFDQRQLSKNAKAAINEARQNGEGLAISDITLLELMTLTSKGRIPRYQPRILLSRNRGAVYCLTDQRARMRAGARASGGLS
jgi:PIN domain nuclease of toxin-antitoxin system